jgi:hypothetical protein
MMTRLMQFGEEVDGYDTPVLNEREIRAAAGVLFLFVFTSLLLILLRQDFRLVKYVITFFLADFAVRLGVSPRFSPTLVLGRLIVGRQTPEYVSAAPKRFAWTIGLLLSGTMFVHLVLVNAYGPIAGLSCLACLLFLFFESAFGICLGCLVYRWIPGSRPQRCAGEACARIPRQAIQRTSKAQALTLAAFVALVGVTVVLFSHEFAAPPHSLFGVSDSSAR